MVVSIPLKVVLESGSVSGTPPFTPKENRCWPKIAGEMNKELSRMNFRIDKKRMPREESGVSLTLEDHYRHPLRSRVRDGQGDVTDAQLAGNFGCFTVKL